MHETVQYLWELHSVLWDQYMYVSPGALYSWEFEFLQNVDWILGTNNMHH